MIISKNTIALILALCALAISCYGVFFKSTNPSLKQFKIYTPTEKKTDIDSALANELIALNKKVTQLALQITQLQQQQPLSLDSNKNQNDLKEFVLTILAESEQQKIEDAKASNPLYGFYAELPEDYDLRIKSDPAFAKNTNDALRDKILNVNLTDLERLAALSQLQMNMFILNKSAMPEYDYESVSSILDLAITSNNDKFRIQAIEITTQAPVVDYRLVERFSTLLKYDANDYIRNLASQGLVSQYYQAKNTENDYAQQIAEHILSLYNNTADEKIKALLNDMIGNKAMLDELRKSADG